jgi:hypothetical protein
MNSGPTIRRAGHFVLAAAWALTSTACDSSTEPPEEGTPAVVTLAVADAPAFNAEEYYPGCITGPESPSTISVTCPVLRWAGFEYWAMSFGDNRSSMAIHAYDADGELQNVEERTGARYLYAIEIDETTETVTFRGQVDSAITMTWDELRDLR